MVDRGTVGGVVRGGSNRGIRRRRAVAGAGRRTWLALACVLLLLGCDGSGDSDDGDGNGTGVGAPGRTSDRHLDGVDPASAPAVYTYTTNAGTRGFADSLGQVPRAYRSRARIALVAPTSLNGDLAEGISDSIALESELARAFAQRVSAEHTSLAASPGCVDAREVNAEADGALGTARWLWREHSTWVLAGGLALLLLLATPFIARRVGAARWARAVLLGVGALASMATMAHVGTHATGALQDARRVASLCDDASDDPVERAGTVARLRHELDTMNDRRDRALDSLQ